jgi:hypothetical protein
MSPSLVPCHGPVPQGSRPPTLFRCKVQDPRRGTRVQCPASRPPDLALLPAESRRTGELPLRPWANPETISWTWQIPAGPTLLPPELARECRNIQPHSNVPCVLSVSLELTTYGPTYEPTPTRGHSCVQCVGKRLRDSMIASVTKVCTVARRNSSARGNYAPHLASIGVAAGDSPEQTLWAGISDRKRAEYASNRSSRRKRSTGRTGR